MRQGRGRGRGFLHIGRFILQERECKRCGKKEFISAGTLLSEAAQEQEPRETCGTRRIVLFQRRPLVWIPMQDMDAAGDAWRSRSPKIRRQFSRETRRRAVERQEGIASAYMFILTYRSGEMRQSVYRKSLF